jgi:choline dehydrogenase-like flavoprotein
MTALPDKTDILVIGSGMAGAHLALELAGAGRRVTMLEAGPRKKRSEWFDNFTRNPVKGPQSPYPSVPYAPHPEDRAYDDFYVQAGAEKFVGAYLRIFGGSSWHWTGFADRLRPADFRMQSLYGVAKDWPVSYDQLEPFYEIAEAIWGVAGHPDHVWGAPRRTPYQMPPIPATYLDNQVERALNAMGLHAAVFSHARNSVQFDNRPPCCGNNTCVPICPIGAKLDGSVIAEKAEAAGTEVIIETLVDFLELGADGRVARAHVRRPDGSRHQIEAETFALCGHAIENPRLLLNSAQPAAPNGVANGSDAVGRYLITQANQDTSGVTAEPVYPYRGPQQTSGLVELRDGPFRGAHAAVGTSFMNSGHSGNSDGVDVAKKLIAQGLKGTELSQELNRIVSRHLRLNSSAEILPTRENRLTLADTRDTAGVPKPKVSVTMDDYTLAGLERSETINREVLTRLGSSEIRSNAPYLSNAIIGGTARMGTDPRTSVVDPYQRTHQHPNLFVLGSSAHVTMPVNAPTLTIAAMAVRTARHIMAR